MIAYHIIMVKMMKIVRQGGQRGDQRLGYSPVEKSGYAPTTRKILILFRGKFFWQFLEKKLAKFG